MEEILKQIKSLRKKKNELIKEHYKIISGMETEISELKKELRKVCPHTESKVVDCDYDEPKMRSPIKWQEKICKRCGKVIATSEETTKTVWREVK